MKYRPQFPKRFGGFEDALTHCRSFFEWYNDEHYHSGIGLLTPAVLHYGEAEKVIEDRADVLQDAYAAHPERFVRGCPKPQALPTEVWINPPAPTSETSLGSNPPLIEIQTPSRRIAAKTELEISPLTSAKAVTRLEIPCQSDLSLNRLAHEKGLSEIVDLGKPEAPHINTLAHPRPS